MELTEKRCAQFCIHLTESEAEKIKERAKKARRAPCEFLYLLVIDYLDGVIK